MVSGSKFTSIADFLLCCFIADNLFSAFGVVSSDQFSDNGLDLLNGLEIVDRVAFPKKASTKRLGGGNASFDILLKPAVTYPLLLSKTLSAGTRPSASAATLGTGG